MKKILVLIQKNNIFLREMLKDFKINNTEIYYLPIEIQNKSIKKKDAISFFETIQERINKYNIDLIITDVDIYYKSFGSITNISKTFGDIRNLTIKEFNQINILYFPPYIKYIEEGDEYIHKINILKKQIISYIKEEYKPIGQDILKTEIYPKTIYEIKKQLDFLKSITAPISVDIETFSLRFVHAGIGTIAFSWNETEGIAFCVDLGNSEEVSNSIRKLLYDFFINNKNKLIFHNGSFDITVLVYQLFMKDIDDYEGLLFGLNIFFRNVEDTIAMAYIHKNTCSSYSLSLKSLSQEYTGNYALEEIKDITKIPIDLLLKYNLTDTCATYYVYNKYNMQKYYDYWKEHNQCNFYKDMQIPMIKNMIQMQLTGVPLDYKRLQEVHTQLTTELNSLYNKVLEYPIIKDFIQYNREKEVEKYNKTHKVKQKTIEDFEDVFINLNSGPQLQVLIYSKEFMNIKPFNFTEKNQPSVDGKTLSAIKDIVENEEYKQILECIVDIFLIEKIVSTYTSTMLELAIKHKDAYFIHGNFNTTATVSGRLSSSSPNLQNLPAGSKYGKLLKECFKAPSGWLFVGIDFALI